MTQISRRSFQMLLSGSQQPWRCSRQTGITSANTVTHGETAHRNEHWFTWGWIGAVSVGRVMEWETGRATLSSSRERERSSQNTSIILSPVYTAEISYTTLTLSLHRSRRTSANSRHAFTQICVSSDSQEVHDTKHLRIHQSTDVCAAVFPPQWCHFLEDDANKELAQVQETSQKNKMMESDIEDTDCLLKDNILCSASGNHAWWTVKWSIYPYIWL